MDPDISYRESTCQRADCPSTQQFTSYVSGVFSANVRAMLGLLDFAHSVGVLSCVRNTPLQLPQENHLINSMSSGKF